MLNGDICGGRIGRGSDWYEGEGLGRSIPRCEGSGTGPVGVGNDGGGMLR